MIHEIKGTIWVNTPHGKAIAMFLIDYGIQQNTIWVCACKKTGKVKHYDSNQISVEVNYTIDFNLKDK